MLWRNAKGRSVPVWATHVRICATKPKTARRRNIGASKTPVTVASAPRVYARD